MSKSAKKKNSEKRRAAKRARKTANYLRNGPKAGHSGRRQKRKKHKSLKGIRHPKGPVKISPPGPKARRRRRGLRHSNPGQHHPKLPLQPLRKRRKLGSGDSWGSARGRAIAEAIDRDIAEVRGKTQEVAVLDDAWDKGKQD